MVARESRTPILVMMSLLCHEIHPVKVDGQCTSKDIHFTIPKPYSATTCNMTVLHSESAVGLVKITKCES